MFHTQTFSQKLLYFKNDCGKLDNAKLIEYNDKSIISKGIVFPFGVLLLYLFREFDKNANSVDMDTAVMLVILNQFGDYRSLRFLCGYFGSRTFYFFGGM